ncbi:hypothetical protein SS50377_28058 [Spironucleus salmonicida]|uniref:Uncharacterized protein n=1 Tax=Spironucleus salmonicida TaxID=348837 RepID=V6LDM2_9EUKA|nr:hypothetical protein SS50377_28058 [Spironucleus salmonicida]|eukprot:EST42610.1 Hypothetical protein SS50377_17930 [Spironucleus salmonicida]
MDQLGHESFLLQLSYNISQLTELLSYKEDQLVNIQQQFQDLQSTVKNDFDQVKKQLQPIQRVDFSQQMASQFTSQDIYLKSLVFEKDLQIKDLKNQVQTLKYTNQQLDRQIKFNKQSITQPKVVLQKNTTQLSKAITKLKNATLDCSVQTIHSFNDQKYLKKELEEAKLWIKKFSVVQEELDNQE